MDSSKVNINQYEYDCTCDDPLLSNKELPPLMDWFEEESCDFSTFQGNCLIGMQNPSFDLVDQDDLAWSLSDVMSLQAEYPFEELDMTLWEDNVSSNNPSYGHITADQCSIRKSNDVLVSMSGLNPIEKENGDFIMSGKEDEHGWQGMKLPSTGIKSYGHMSGADQYSIIPNVLDRFLVSDNCLNANEKINGAMIMSSTEDVNGWYYCHMSSNPYSIPNSMVSNRGLNVNEKENGAMTNISKNEDGYGWQGMKVQGDTIMHHSQMNAERKERSRSIDFEEMSKYFYVPIMQVALNVGLTVLKKRCRELGIYRWPHRKMKSLDSLIHNVQEMKIRGEGEGCERIEVERLIEHKRMIEKMPDMELTKETKKLRQACFKANFKKRRLMAIGPY